jgi:hypothetical protein
MKRNFLIVLMLAAAASFAAAQITTPSTDVLGAHLNYGRGCAGCHAPHSGTLGNGIATTDTNTGNIALWGEDVGPLLGVTIVTGKSEHGSYSETLPSTVASGTPDVSGILMCLSCHDGVLAKGAMMQNKIYETLPSTYGANKTNIPTLLGNDGTGAGNYLNDHPVGSNAIIGCGGQYNWDCTVSASGKIQPGPLMTQFINNYGLFIKPGVMNAQPVVLCTTCHNQHVMNVVAVKNQPFTYTDGTVAPSGTPTGLPSGTYATMFFIRAPYNPGDVSGQNNQTAQFCRQCHGGESNEMNGSTAGTTF